MAAKTVDATKALYLTQTGITLTQIASINYFNFQGSMHAFVDDNGDCIFCFPSQSVNGGTGWAALRIDSLGNYQLYQTPDWSGGMYYNDTSELPIWIGPAQLYVPTYRDGLIFATIPKYKGNGRTIITWPSLNLQNSCIAGSPNNIYFDSENSLVAGEWIQAFSGSNNYFSSVYKANFYAASLSKITDGFVGNSPQDIFNQTYNISYPNLVPAYPGLSSADYVILQNGMQSVCNFGTTGYSNWGVAFEQTKIVPGTISDCVTPNGSYVTTKTALVTTLTPSGFITNGGSFLPGYTDIPNVQCQFSNGGVPFLSDINGNIFQIYTTNLTNILGSGYGFLITKTGDMFYATFNNGPQGPLAVYHAKIQIPGIMGLPSNSVNQIKNSLVNLSRPVSVLGKYRT